MKFIVKFLEDIVLYGLEKVGLYYSQYRGFVSNNDDPKNYGRLQVTVPEIFGDGTLKYWAWPRSNFSGKGYGCQVIPRINDFIWVTFEKGNPRKPLWDFGYFGANEKPTDLVNKNLYWFRTPSGLTILLDDNNESITLFKKDGTIEKALLGDTTKTKLESLIDILKAAQINTNLGPQSFIAIYQQQLSDLKNSLGSILSKNNKLS